MEKILNTVAEFLKFANNYWTVVIIIIGLAYALYDKIKKYLATSKEEKIEMAKKALKENLLKYAEIEWSSYEKAGEIKRAQVISKIYEDYPILKEYVDQDELIKFIDKQIDSMKSEIDKVITKSLE